MSFFNFLKKKEEDFQFVDVTEENVVYSHYPVQLAKDVPTVMKKVQEEKYEKYNFVVCPGMHDYSRLGYIIPAWTNIHIKANKAGVVAVTGSLGKESIKRGTPIGQPRPMETQIADGLVTFQDGVPPHVFNSPGAWRIMSDKNVSALVLPPFFHANFLDDIYIYPGIVDYNKFSTLNLIFSAKRKCEITIKAGEPLLHIIPFITNQDIVASYGPATREQLDSSKLIRWFHDKNFYRKYYMIKKKFKLFKKVPP